jgi:2-polyprenyl-6-methoxyphenol hydroxylase-like FAD-dependent oxidoreductase
MVALARRVATTAATRYTSSCGRRQLASTLTDTARTTTPVAIVGAGPVGLTLALLLSKFGVRSTVVERLPAPSVHPQAHFINVRSMEVFRSIVNHEGHSVADAITSLARPRAEWSRFLYNAGPLLHGTSLGSTNHFPPETLLSIRGQSPELPTHLPQHQLVPILLEALTQRPQSHAPCDIHWCVTQQLLRLLAAIVNSVAYSSVCTQGSGVHWHNTSMPRWRNPHDQWWAAAACPAGYLL